MFSFLTRSQRRKALGERLYQHCVSQARKPYFYSNFGVDDTPEGRFELISLHVSLFIRRLNREGEEGRDAAQELFDAMFRDMDHALREMGVGDLSVSKKIRALAEAFYGDMKAYTPALDARDKDLLSLALSQHVEHASTPERKGLAEYMLASESTLNEQAGPQLLTGNPPEFADSLLASA